ncbi:MAG: hypothetical protein ABH891_09035 [Candidatus Omnitrophota bacterium]
MKKTTTPFRKHSMIEITLCGHGLRAQEKTSARELFLNCRVPERDLVFSDYKDVFRVSCYTRSVKKVREIRKKYKAWSSPAGRSFIKHKERSRSFVLKIKKLERHDWFDKWKRDYHIKPLSTKYVIVPF